MEVDPLSAIILFMVLLLLSAFYSGAETAYFSLSKALIARLGEEKTASSGRILNLLKERRRLLITILTANTIVNVAAATIAAILAFNFSQVIGLGHKLTLFFEVAVVTFVILVLSEVTPKVIAVRNPIVYARNASLLVSITYYVLFPLTYILSGFVNAATKLVQKRVTDEDELLTPEEVQILLDLGEERGELEAEEKEMIHSIFEFSETQVKEIMIPRIDMVCVEFDVKLPELIKIIKEAGHTRIPVYQETIDNINGIINAKDLLPHVKSKKDDIDLLKLARPPFFVPDSKKIDELLREFQSEKTHMAIAVDEYGGTAGLITLEDVIEEIVGEIQDEYDKELPLIQEIDEKTIVVDAKIGIDELNEEQGLNLPEEEGYESLGGFIMHQTGNVPDKNVKIQHNGYEFKVEEVTKRRIVKVRIEKIEQDPDNTSE